MSNNRRTIISFDFWILRTIAYEHLLNPVSQFEEIASDSICGGLGIWR